MHKYRTLAVWQRAHALVLLVLRATDAANQPRCWAVFDQLRRAAISVEANVVEGYALSTAPQFRRHLRIAMGSAAEAECLIRTTGEMNYLSKEVVDEMSQLVDGVLRTLFGLLRQPIRTAS